MSDSWSEFISSAKGDLPPDVVPIRDEVNEPPASSPPQDIGELTEDLLLDAEDWVSEALALLEDRKQMVLYGPPGTGKTYVARAIARYLSGGQGGWEVVQFHPSFTYEQFVEGYRPLVTEEDALVYRLKPGPLVEFAELAARNPDRRFVLLIDEINRGNLPKIFGELLYLLEYRGESVRMMYREADEPPFSLPSNLYLLGTMNTADRSIGTIDAALRRRFHFLGLFPSRSPISQTLSKWVRLNAPEVDWLVPVVDRLNERLASIDRQLQVGHSFFMRSGIDQRMVELIWKADVLPYLEDGLFGRDDVNEAFALARIRAEVGADGDGDSGDADDLPQGA